MLNLLKTLIRPDQEEDPESNIVARAANILQVGEFQLLQLAYEDWYGRELPIALCDQLFQSYMLHDRIPLWARHYARRIIESDERGLIDANDGTYHRYDREYVTHVTRGVRHFVLASMVLAGILTGGVLIGHLSAGESTSLLPPYFDLEELRSGADPQEQ
jgi:hypothetical protein